MQGVRFLRDPLDFYVRLHRRYGDLFTVSMPIIGRVVYVADPKLVKSVFTSSPQEVHAGEPNAKLLEPSFGPNSLLTLDEAPHMRQRKLLLPPFHGEQIQRYGALMRDITTKEMERWPIGKPFQLRAHTQRIALAVILQCVFGIHDPARLERAAQLIGQFVRPANVITLFPALRRNLGPLGPWAWFMRVKKALDEFIFEEIAIHRRDGRDAARDSVLGLLLSARDDHGEPMTDMELRDELVTIVGAGNETTATALAWAMERLLRTPRVLAKLRESIAAGEEDYLAATVKETLRVRPVVSEVMRKLTGPAELGGYQLPAGTALRPAVAALHYREDLFPEPYEFRPERFLDGKADNYAWIPFGGGVRRCIGAAFAEYEMRSVLRIFIEHAELSAPKREPERVKLKNATLTPAKGTVVSLDRPLR